MTEKFTYSIYKTENAIHVRELFLRVFRKKVSVDYIKNKYNTFYAKCGPLASIAFLKDEPVAFYGAIPVEIKKGADSFLAAHACDSMTLKKYRGKGLHYQLALLSYDEMKRQNIKFVFAMHSDNTLKATGKLNWQTGKPLSRFHVKVNLPKAIKFLSVLKNKTKITGVEEINRKYFFNPLGNMDRMHINYSDSYLNYKCFSDNKIIELAGCQFWLKMNNSIWIGAVNGLNENNMDEVLKELQLFSIKNKTDELIFQTSKDNHMHQLLSKKFNPVDSFPVGYLSFDKSIDPEELLLNFADLDSF